MSPFARRWKHRRAEQWLSAAVDAPRRAPPGSQQYRLCSQRQAIEFTAAPRGNSPAPQLAVLPSRPPRASCLAGHGGGGESGRRLEVLVDATTGEVIKRTNLLVSTVDAAAKRRNCQVLQTDCPWLDRGSRRAADNGDRPVGGAGQQRLAERRLCEPDAAPGRSPAKAYSPTHEFVYAADDPRFEEVMVYHYVDSTQRYVQSRRLQRPNSPANGIRDRDSGQRTLV